MNIHPTAVVHPEAQIGQGVEIGPYAIIEGAARIGDGCVIQAHAVITRHVMMGNENNVGYGTVIGSDPQDFAFQSAIQSEVHIGDRNKFREHCTVHRGTAEGSSTVVGDDNFFMAGSHLGHNVRVGNRVVVANNALLGGHVQVADRVFIGGGAVFHQFTRVGQMAIIQGIAGFSKDVPPYTIGAGVNMVAGLNVIGLRRSGLDAEQRREIRRAFDLLYRSKLNVRQALEAAAEQEWTPEGAAFFTFVREAKKRGVCALQAVSVSPLSAGEEG